MTTGSKFAFGTTILFGLAAIFFLAIGSGPLFALMAFGGLFSAVVYDRLHRMEQISSVVGKKKLPEGEELASHWESEDGDVAFDIYRKSASASKKESDKSDG